MPSQHAVSDGRNWRFWVARVWLVTACAAVTLLAAGCDLDPASDDAIGPAPAGTVTPATSVAPRGASPRPPGDKSASAGEQSAPSTWVSPESDADSVVIAKNPLPAGVDGAVTRHTDGDTLRVDGVKIRFIGMDTPELAGSECYGKTAAARTAALLPLGARVRLVYDVQRNDRYGRVLAYVYRLSDGLFVNAELVRGGFASIMTVPPNVAHAETFLGLQRQARDGNRGLWSECAPPAPAAGAPSGFQPLATPMTAPLQAAAPTPAPLKPYR